MKQVLNKQINEILFGGKTKSELTWMLLGKLWNKGFVQ